MGSKRTVILIAALLIGAVASYALYTYVSGVEDRAYQNAQRVRVYVLAQNVPADTAADALVSSRVILERDIPTEFLPPSAITDISLIAGKVARTDLSEGQIVVDGMFGDQAEVMSTWADRLEVNQVAVTVNVDQVRAVGGLLQPGDRVSMLVRSAPPATSGGGAVEGAAAPVSFLYQNVQILAIGGVGVGQADAAAAPAGGMMTFAVPPDAAQRIIFAGDTITLLLEPKNYVATDLPPVDAGNLFDKPLTPNPATAGN